jgi:ribonuclease HII
VELGLRRQGYRQIAGLDEAGRGAWAGPVVAAAVILPPWPLAELRAVLPGLTDSKLMSSARRERLAAAVRAVALAVGVGGAGPREIDARGIVRATHTAMIRALAALALAPDALVIDAFALPEAALPQRHPIHGDRLCLSIAAASVVAKVARDAHLVALDAAFPGYGFAAHKGYGTPAHRAALARLGACSAHRLSYAPLRAFAPALAQPAPAQPAH